MNVASLTWAELETEEIVRLLHEQTLKRWWVAEVAGIHKTTLRRWLARGIRKVRTHRAAALAEVLGVRVEQITRGIVIDDRSTT